VTLLLEKGADVNAQGGHYGNALQAASDGGHDSVVTLLLEKGADVNAQGGHLWQCTSGSFPWRFMTCIVTLLLENGADVNAQGGHYGNALQAAC
jgi:ankyrin repeat protein